MVEIGKEYMNNLSRVRELVNYCINQKEGTRLQNMGVLITPLKESALCYECIKPTENGGINVLILHHKKVIEKEEYNFHESHYKKDG